MPFVGRGRTVRRLPKTFVFDPPFGEERGVSCPVRIQEPLLRTSDYELVAGGLSSPVRGAGIAIGGHGRFLSSIETRARKVRTGADHDRERGWCAACYLNHFFRTAKRRVERAALDVSPNGEAGRGWSAGDRPRSRRLTRRRWCGIGLLCNGGVETCNGDLRCGRSHSRGCCCRWCSGVAAGVGRVVNAPTEIWVSLERSQLARIELVTRNR